jgi:ABC-type amino acid transport substrate-binding protein
MKTAFLRGSALLLAASLAACATSNKIGGGRGGIDVARFHLGEPIARAQIAIEPFDRADANRPEFAGYVAAVARQLASHGWTVVDTTRQSEQIALIDVEQGSREAIAALTAARIGRGVAPGPAEGSAANRTATLLEVRIRRRSDATVFWEGRAVTEAATGSAEAQRGAAVEKLAEALFRDFPGESGRTIRVR